MFKPNDVIIYGTQGICEIACLEEKIINGTKKTYFVLKPVNDKGSTIYAPADNAIIQKKMRRLLSVAQINALIDSMPEENTDWITNENERKEFYKRVLAEGNHLELIKMIKSIYAHKKAREAEGKRLHMSDERFFKEAEQILYHEFQYVLHLSGKQDLMTYILSRINSKEA